MFTTKSFFELNKNKVFEKKYGKEYRKIGKLISYAGKYLKFSLNGIPILVQFKAEDELRVIEK